MSIRGISDYGKGVASSRITARAIATARSSRIPVVVDPKGSDWEKYRGASFVTPNLKELNEVLAKPAKNEDDDVERAAKETISRFGLEGIIVTRSERGLTLVDKGGVVHIGARAQEVFDVSGAGDTVIATFALALAGGLPPAECAYLANLAAGVVVAKLGTYAVSRGELLAATENDSAAI